MDDRSNSAKGRSSYDSQLGGSLVSFFNRNITPYPTETGSPSFDLIPVEKQKDIMINVARMHGEQEYNRIMELVTVLQKQAASIKRRLEITDLVHAAKYDFQIYHGNIYWLVFDHRKNYTRLCTMGPHQWSTGGPEDYEYICAVRWLGDYTWIEVDEQGNPLNETQI
jgi:hypothetical protein